MIGRGGWAGKAPARLKVMPHCGDGNERQMTIGIPSPTLGEQDLQRVSECMGRLRLIQADSARLPAAQRREFLSEEVERSLKEVSPASRKPYVQALLQRFPVGGVVATATVPAQASPAPAPPPPPPPKPLSAEELLERLLDAVKQVPEAKRAEFSQRLQQAGLVWVDRDALVIEVTEEFRQRIGLKPEAEVRLSRVVQLAATLTDLLARLDKTALNTLRELSPRSPLLRRPQDFRAAVSQFLISEEETLEPQKPAAELLGALLAAILGGGRDFGQDYVRRMSPDAIKQIVHDEGKSPGFLETWAKLYWDKYQVLAEDYATADKVDHRIKDCFGGFVDRRVPSGRDRPG